MSLHGLELGVHESGGKLEFRQCSHPPSASLIYTSSTGETFPVSARREQGYTVLRFRALDRYRYVLDPFGNVVCILDSGAQVCLMGEASQGYLANCGPPPPNTRLFGVGNNRLNVVAIGYMTFSFAALPGIPGDIPRRMIQHVHGNQFRVGMVSTRQVDASLRAVPAAAARGRRGAAHRHPVGRLLEAAVVSTGLGECEARRVEQIEVRQAASRLAIFDLPTFQVFPRVADGLTESGEPLEYFLGLEGGHNYRECVAAARGAFRFHECHPAGGGAWARARWSAST
jgi:hypothetical protein